MIAPTKFDFNRYVAENDVDPDNVTFVFNPMHIYGMQEGDTLTRLPRWETASIFSRHNSSIFKMRFKSMLWFAKEGRFILNDKF